LLIAVTTYGMKTSWCHYFIRILLDLYMFRAHRPIFRRVHTAVHTTIGSVSVPLCSSALYVANRAVQKLNQWLCEQLYELSWRCACGPETCRDPAIYEYECSCSKHVVTCVQIQQMQQYAYRLCWKIMIIRWSKWGTVKRRLTTGIRSEKCIVGRFRRRAKVIECTYTHLDSINFKLLVPCIFSTYGMKTNWCHCFICILLDLYMFRAHRHIFRRVHTAVHTTTGSVSVLLCSRAVYVVACQ